MASVLSLSSSSNTKDEDIIPIKPLSFRKTPAAILDMTRSLILNNPQICFQTFPEGNRFSIDALHWTKLIKLPRKELYLTISRIIREYNIIFPETHIARKKAQHDFINLKSLVQAKANFLVSGSEPQYSGLQDLRYSNYHNPLFDDVIDVEMAKTGEIASDYCQFPARVLSNCHGYPSPRDIWNGPDDVLRAKLIQRMSHRYKGQAVGEKEIAKAISKSFLTPSQFKAGVLPGVLRILRELSSTPEEKKWKVLDPCAGWSNRLIGALASECMVSHYVGIDPNAALVRGQKRAVRAFESSVDVQHICKCAEDVLDEDYKDPSMKFDVVLTSPPFFTKEIYSSDSTQSVNKHSQQDHSPHENYRQWVENFLFQMLTKAWDKLEDNGYLVINITDVSHTESGTYYYYPICKDMNDYIEYTLRGSYQGSIGLPYEKVENDLWGLRCEPLWVWQKRALKPIQNPDHRDRAQILPESSTSYLRSSE